ncbi:Protein-glutamate methylesterase/protein-glutamine glutaminase [Dyadobacter sp. CECT 9275]|uniref:Protein-glutamate methylesterase/protein-glutamine glutaminase n=1 Tax=Dyadobacter helix TaxID=2822344 RepID=A0A916JDI9_9BACT|nr:response regulator [Dyadobacter sp. CECT 9275]CAG5004937.1 Protein-glutamate methylesterase/protein-glutamine glutaminase [Dyadobacter sp. CECT 9275]
MKSLNVLVVEDDLLIASNIRRNLEEAGYQVSGIARNYEEALQAARDSPPDMALIDIQLEDSFDGIYTANELLRHHWIPIVFLTADSRDHTFQRAQMVSPRAYLLKPFRQTELVMQLKLAHLNFQPTTKKEHVPDHLFLPYEKGYERVVKADILYVNSVLNGSYVHIFEAGKEKPRLITMNIGYLGQFLNGPDFYRVSRSLLINLSYIERIERNHLKLKDYDQLIFIPEGNRTDLMDRLAVIKTRR